MQLFMRIEYDTLKYPNLPWFGSIIGRYIRYQAPKSIYEQYSKRVIGYFFRRGDL